MTVLARVWTWFGLAGLIVCAIVWATTGVVMSVLVGSFGWFLVFGSFVRSVEFARRPSHKTDRLADMTAVWLADPRPAWETIAAFERDLEKVLRGDVTADYVERMPLRVGGLPPATRQTRNLHDSGVVLPRGVEVAATDFGYMRHCGNEGTVMRIPKRPPSDPTTRVRA